MDTKISSSFWSDSTIESLSPHQKLAALWLMTCSQCDLLGFVTVTQRRFEFETGCPWDALLELCNAHPKGFVKCEKGVWLRSYIKHQFGKGKKLTSNTFTQAISRLIVSHDDTSVALLVLEEYPEIAEAIQAGKIRGLQGLPEHLNPHGMPILSPSEGDNDTMASPCHGLRVRVGVGVGVGVRVNTENEVNPSADSPTDSEPADSATAEPALPRGIARADVPALLRAKQLFARRPVTNPQLDAAQLRAWAKAKALVLETSEADWQLLAEAYGQTSGPAATYRRKDLAQLLNNWLGEIDRARDWRNRAGAEWSHATPATPASTRRTVIPLEPENWQSVAARIWPDSDPGTLGWNDLSPDVQVRIRQEIAASNSSAA